MYAYISLNIKRINVSQKNESSRIYQIIQRYDTLTAQYSKKFIEPLSDSREIVIKFRYEEELLYVTF